MEVYQFSNKPIEIVLYVQEEYYLDIARIRSRNKDFLCIHVSNVVIEKYAGGSTKE